MTVPEIPEEWRTVTWNDTIFGLVSGTYRDGILDIGMSETQAEIEVAFARLGAGDTTRLPIHVKARKMLEERGAPEGLVSRHQRVWFMEQCVAATGPKKQLQTLLDEHGMVHDDHTDLHTHPWEDTDKFVTGPLFPQSGPVMNLSVKARKPEYWSSQHQHIPTLLLCWLDAYTVYNRQTDSWSGNEKRAAFLHWVPEEDWRILGSVEVPLHANFNHR